MKKVFTKEFTIGLCVIVALLILFLGIDYLKGINFMKPSNFYYVEYTNVAGLEITAPVTIDGYQVGQVREIEFDYQNSGPVKVVLSLDSKLKVPEDSYASIVSGLLNGASIDLHLGKSKKMIEVGGTIKSEIAPDMMSAISNDLMPKIGNILPQIDSLLAAVNRLVSDPALTNTVRNLDGISTNLLDATDGLKGTLKSDVPAILGSTRSFTHNLDTISTDLTLLSAQLRSLPIAATVENVNELTANLMEFSKRLNSDKSTLGKLNSDPELYNRINRVAADVDSLLVDLKRNPKRYISIKLF